MYKKHKSLLKDLVMDTSGQALFQRAQICVWNLLFGLYYLYQAWRTLSLPDIDESMIVLMGLSAGAYVGGKAAELNMPRGSA